MGDDGRGIETRLLTAADVAVLENVDPDVFDEAIDPRRLATYLAAAGHFMIVALDGEMVVGQIAAVIHRHPDKVSELYIDEVGVAPQWQRRGVASQLMNEMIALGRSHGCAEAWVGTEPDNVAARALYNARSDGQTFVMYVFDI